MGRISRLKSRGGRERLPPSARSAHRSSKPKDAARPREARARFGIKFITPPYAYAARCDTTGERRIMHAHTGVVEGEVGRTSDGRVHSGTTPVAQASKPAVAQVSKPANGSHRTQANRGARAALFSVGQHLPRCPPWRV